MASLLQLSLKVRYYAGLSKYSFREMACLDRHLIVPDIFLNKSGPHPLDSKLRDLSFTLTRVREQPSNHNELGV